MLAQQTGVVRLEDGLDAFLARCVVYDHIESAVAVLDLAGVRYANSSFDAFNRAVRDAPEHLQRLASLLTCPDFASWLQDALTKGEVASKRQRVYYGIRIEVELTFCLRPLVGPDGELLGGMLTVGEESMTFDRLHFARLQESRKNLVERVKQLDREKAGADRLSRLLLRDAPAAMLLLNDKRQIVQANRAAEGLFGVPVRQLVGRTCDAVLGCFDRYGECPLLSRSAIDGDLCDGLRADGRAISMLRSATLLDNGGERVVVEAFIDMTERREAEDRIAHLAHHDALTGLLNRRSLQERLEQALASAQRDVERVAILFVDIDRFKSVNDSLGHQVGDLLLIEIGRRLRQLARASDIVARFGGDEFIVVLTGMPATASAALLANKILHSLRAPYVLDEQILYSTPSIGISVYPDDSSDGATLLKNADAAMYHAKEQGRNNIQFFTAAMNAAASERLMIERELRIALKECQLELHYQPQICVEDGKTCGVEALVRWLHPQLGQIPPLKFIPIAEEAGLIEELGLWVLNEACRQAAAWRREGLAGIKMAVNLSANQLRSPSLVVAVRDALERYCLNDGDLELEVTESVAMDDPERAIERLRILRALGVDLAIDDFGTGYSSLAYLKLLPIQRLKLDRAFVRDIETDSNDAAISAATLALAHSLGLKVVAEGVETEGQRRFLEMHRCDYLQGYLFGKPEPASVWSALWKNAPDTIKRVSPPLPT